MRFSAWRILCAFAVLSSAPLHAQEWPAKPVRVILSLGGGAEPGMRAAAERLTEALGQPFVVDLQAGAGGQIGAEMGARAAPDGYTLLLTSPNSHVNRTVMVKKLPYDPVKDFTPIAKVAETILCVVVSRSFPAQSLQQLIDYAKANPGKLSYSTTGIGTGHHLNAEQLQTRTGTRMVHIPYKTRAPADARPRVRPRAARVHRDRHRAAAGAGRKGAHHRHHRLQALRAAARCADHPGNRAGLREPARMAGILRSGRHAARARETHRGRHPQGVPAAGAARQVGRARASSSTHAGRRTRRDAKRQLATVAEIAKQAGIQPEGARSTCGCGPRAPEAFFAARLRRKS